MPTLTSLLQPPMEKEQQWNVTPRLLGGSNLYFFTDLYCARIGLNARFALPTKEGCKERAFRPIRAQYIGL